MSIRRCPYCKALIDEGAAYCSNCGTRLLFPEDEQLEEEIPGERIVEEKEERPRRRGRKVRSGKSPRKQDSVPAEEAAEAEPEPKLEAESEEAFEEVDESGEEEVRLIDDKPDIGEEPRNEFDELFGEKAEPVDEEASEADIPRSEEIVEESGEPELRTEESDEIISGELTEEESQPPQTPSEPAGRGTTDILPERPYKRTEDARRAEQLRPDRSAEAEAEEAKQIRYHSGEQMSIFDPIEKEKEDIERFLRSLKKDREKKIQVPETGEGLPPWASGIKRPKRTPTGAARVRNESEESRERTGIEYEDDRRPPAVSEEAVPGGRIAQWLKCRAFDLAFVLAIWLIAVLVASMVLGTSLIRFVSASPLLVALFLAILLVQYFFFFYFFLGFTLGDRLFSQRE